MRKTFSAGVLVLMLTTLVGCASPAPRADGITEAQARHLISQVLEDIEQIYLTETKTSELVSSGLRRVQDTIPNIEFSSHDAMMVASVGKKVVSRFRVGKDYGATDYWGDRIAEMLQQVSATDTEKGEIPLTQLTDSFLHGVAERLKHFTYYVPPKWAGANETSPAKGGGALDLVLLQKPEGWQVARFNSATLGPSGPLRKGDLLLAIDGTLINGLSGIEVLPMLHGEIGSTIELSIIRVGHEQPLSVTLQREPVAPVAPVAHYPLGSAFVIDITWIEAGMVQSLKRTLAETITTADSGYNGVILDLRGTIGGALEPVVDLADTFLAVGPMFSTRGRHEESEQHFAATGEESFPLPMVVLVDNYTGSGGEIVAAALQDSGNVVVVGSISFGKGTIETVLPLPNGGVLKLAWVEVVTSGGYRLDKRGVMPTVCTGGKVTAEEVIGALRGGGGAIDHATRIRDVDPEDADAVEAFRALCPPREDQDEDVALEVARAILADPALYERLLSPAL